MSMIIKGRRVLLRPLRETDFDAWNEVRDRCGDWLTRWEPLPPAGWGDPNGRRLFVSRCMARESEARTGASHSFGIFVDGRFIGEANLSGIARGALQSGNIGYWIDMKEAGHGYVPEAVATIFRFAFEDLGLHRIQISIVPRNQPSHRVVEKLELRHEGMARRYIEIAGVWEDHDLFAITVEEWIARRRFFMDNFILPRL
ncbi:MAG: GNAT family protein [Actinomycetota bacterium]|nr:GNAT family protein [Actinomycetota bacterium]